MYVTFLLKYTPQGSREEPVKISCTPRIGSNVFYKRFRQIKNFPQIPVCVVYFMKKSYKNIKGLILEEYLYNRIETVLWWYLFTQ